MNVFGKCFNFQWKHWIYLNVTSFNYVVSKYNAKTHGVILDITNSSISIANISSIGDVLVFLNFLSDNVKRHHKPQERDLINKDFHWSFFDCAPNSKVHGANMGPTWALSAPDGPHVGPMNLAIMGVDQTVTTATGPGWAIIRGPSNLVIHNVQEIP